MLGRLGRVEFDACFRVVRGRQRFVVGELNTSGAGRSLAGFAGRGMTLPSMERV